MLLFAHKDVEDYFQDVDASHLDEATAHRIATAYEDGKVIHLSGLRPDFDAAFFERMPWRDLADLKKLKSVGVSAYHEAVVRGEAPAEAPDAPRNTPAAQYGRLLREVFGGDLGRMAELVAQMRAINGFLLETTARIFPGYRYSAKPITWRLSPTMNENLHLDVYNEDLPDHHVRMFVNLDTAHRAWHTSHGLDWLLQRHLVDLDPEFVSSASPGRICHALNFKVFGGFETAGREGAPKHVCFFDPGDVWLVDSRKVSHQIFYGRRAVSTDFQVEPASMLDPAKHYFAVVERRRAAFHPGLA